MDKKEPETPAQLNGNVAPQLLTNCLKCPCWNYSRNIKKNKHEWSHFPNIQFY